MRQTRTTTWRNPKSITSPEDANYYARLAEAIARGTHWLDYETMKAYHADLRELWKLACLYTKQAIRLAKTSAARKQYAAWYRDYHYRLIWEV